LIKNTLLIVFALVILFIFIYSFFTNDKAYKETKVSFSHNNNYLSGVLIEPKNRTNFPVVVFVHGDGATPYNVYGYYRPLWNYLAKKGIASFSWDKAGVGDSTGNWGNQSMDERADEVIEAIKMLKKREDIISNKVGLIGYSQAGWVLPIVASKSNYPDFMILISGAINWIDQGKYLTKTRLTRKGFSQIQIEEVLKYEANSNKLLTDSFSYVEYIQTYNETYPKTLKKNSSPMTANRFQFAKLNWHYDARNNLKDITCPTLAIFGDKDMNIDFAESAKIYKEEFNKSKNNNLTIKTFPSADHGILKSNYFDEIIPGIWFIIKLELLGDKAFANGYLNFIAKWVEENIVPHQIIIQRKNYEK